MSIPGTINYNTNAATLGSKAGEPIQNGIFGPGLRDPKMGKNFCVRCVLDVPAEGGVLRNKMFFCHKHK